MQVVGKTRVNSCFNGKCSTVANAFDKAGSRNKLKLRNNDGIKRLARAQN
jgi:hypothetical protein